MFTLHFHTFPTYCWHSAGTSSPNEASWISSQQLVEARYLHWQHRMQICGPFLVMKLLRYQIPELQLSFSHYFYMMNIFGVVVGVYETVRCFTLELFRLSQNADAAESGGCADCQANSASATSTMLGRRSCHSSGGSLVARCCKHRELHRLVLSKIIEIGIEVPSIFYLLDTCFRLVLGYVPEDQMFYVIFFGLGMSIACLRRIL